MAAPKPLLSILRLFGLTRRRLLIIGASTCVVLLYCCGYGPELVSLQSSHGVAESTPSVAGLDSTSKNVAIEQSEFLTVLQNLYGAHASRIHHSDAIDVEERKQMGDAATYGEILPDGVKQLFSTLGGLRTDDFFVDLGSGTGKVCIQAHVMTSSGKTMGVELGKQRHAFALEASQKLEAHGLRDYDRVLSFIQGDAVALFHMWNSATVVFMNSLRFPPHLMCGLSKLFAELAPGTIVVSSKPLLGCHSCCRSITAMLLRASWHDKVKIHIYAVPPRVDDLLHISLSMNFTQIQAATVARNSPWSQVVQKNEHRRELLGSPNSLEWGSISVAGEEFSLAACKLRDVYDCVVEPHSPRLDVATLAPGGHVLPAGIDALSRVPGAASDGFLFVLGSGEGEVPLYFALTSNVQISFGVEIAAPRHRRAELALEGLQQSGLLPRRDSVKLVQATTFTSLANISEWFQASAVILLSAFWSSHEFSQVMPTLRMLPTCSIVLSLQPLPGCHIGLRPAHTPALKIQTSWMPEGTAVWQYIVVPEPQAPLTEQGTISAILTSTAYPCPSMNEKITVPSLEVYMVAQCAIVDSAVLAPAPPDGCGIWEAEELGKLVNRMGHLHEGQTAVFLGPGWHRAALITSMLWPVHVRFHDAPKEEFEVVVAMQRALAKANFVDSRRKLTFGGYEPPKPGELVFLSAKWALQSKWQPPKDVALVVCCDDLQPYGEFRNEASSWIARSHFSESEFQSYHVKFSCSADEGLEIQHRMVLVQYRPTAQTVP